jgi:hypothetical protein
MSAVDDLVEQYILVVLALGEYAEEYVDTYFGPEKLREVAKARGKIPLNALLEEIQTLNRWIRENEQFAPPRKDYLSAQLRALETTVRIEAGESMSVQEKVEGIYGFRPERTPEVQFEEAHRILDAYLPGKGAIAERRQMYDDSWRVPVDKLEPLCVIILDELRQRTGERLGLPERERVELQFVKDKPYGGYSYYTGNGQSVVEINLELPKYLHYLVDFLAHEIYPGHHTESCFKDDLLIRGQGHREFWVGLGLSPQLFVAEMIATHAREIVLPDDEFEAWLRDELIPQSEIEGAELVDPAKLTAAMHQLGAVTMNAIFMHWDDGVGEEELKAYVKKYGLLNEDEAAHTVRWVKHPVFHVYGFTYYPGYQLLKEVMGRSPDPHEIYARILKEAALPVSIMNW